MKVALATVATAVGVLVAGMLAAAEPSSCVACHEQLDGELSAPLGAWEGDVHRAAGLGCDGCHGGDPAPELAEDAETAMAPARGFRGAPDRFQTAQFCGTCHADADFMKRFDPSIRIDQLAEYRTSVHGRKNAAGDPVPATCSDCHGAHGVREVASPDAPVHATRVPATCAHCHADPAVMGPYGIGTGQYQDYLGGAHAAALLERGDTAAPACNDCHGNHGATPPGIDSVANVCGQCHGREAQLFGASIKKELFDSMDAAECTTCHANHRTRHPTSESFHGGSAPVVSTGTVTGLAPFSAELGDVEPGAAVEATWSVVLDPHVEPGPALTHQVAITAEGTPALAIDAEVVPGASALAPRRPASGAIDAELTIEALSGLPLAAGDAVRYHLRVAARESTLRSVAVRDQPGPGIVPVQGSVCLQCHSAGDECDQATERMYAAVSAVNHELRAARALLAEAEVAGMDVAQIVFDLESSGVTAAVEARALVHSFDPERVVERAEQGREVARAAVAAGHDALGEIRFRRTGLLVSLVLVGLVAAGLYLKIRQIGGDF